MNRRFVFLLFSLSGCESVWNPYAQNNPAFCGNNVSMCTWPALCDETTGTCVMPDASFTSCGNASDFVTAITTARSANKAGTYHLAVAANCTISFSQPDNYWFGPNALPPIDFDLAIEGQGQTTVLTRNTTEQAAPFRFFYVAGAVNPLMNSGSLTLRNLVLENGSVHGGSGGSISLGSGSLVVGGGGGGAGLGGAIFSQGTLRLIGVTLSDNSATGGGGGSGSANIMYPGAGGGGMAGSGGNIVMAADLSTASGTGGGGFAFSGCADNGNGGGFTGMGPTCLGAQIGQEGGNSSGMGLGGTGPLARVNTFVPQSGADATGTAGAMGGGTLGLGGPGGSPANSNGPPGPYTEDGGGGGDGTSGGGGGAGYAGNGGKGLNFGVTSGGGIGGGGGAFGGGGGGGGAGTNGSVFVGGGGGGGVGGGGGGGGKTSGTQVSTDGSGGGGGFGGGGGGGRYGGSGGFGGGGGSSGDPSVTLAGSAGFGAGRGSTSTHLTMGYNGGGGGGGLGAGGAIFIHQGTLVAANSSFLRNKAAGGPRGNITGKYGQALDNEDGSGLGGAIFNLNGTVELDNVTLSDNAVASGYNQAAEPSGGSMPAPTDKAKGRSVYSLTHGAGTPPSAKLLLKNSLLVASSCPNTPIDTSVSEVFVDADSGSALIDMSAPNLMQPPQYSNIGATTVIPGTPFQDSVQFSNNMSTANGTTSCSATGVSYLVPVSTTDLLAGRGDICQSVPVGGIDELGTARGTSSCTLGAIELPQTNPDGSQAVGCSLGRRPANRSLVELLILGSLLLLGGFFTRGRRRIS